MIATDIQMVPILIAELLLHHPVLVISPSLLIPRLSLLVVQLLLLPRDYQTAEEQFILKKVLVQVLKLVPA
jgi:hypothetical protein